MQTAKAPQLNGIERMPRRIAAGTLVALLLTVGSTAAYYWNDIRQARIATPALFDQAVAKYGRQATLQDLPPDRLTILLKIEDPQFFQHRGVDLATPGAGMTTITQGLTKRLFFPDGFTPGIAKIRQTLIAEYALDDLVTKNDQLELYLNATYFGESDGKPIHGLPAAANAHFAKSHRDLTDDEFIALIAMTTSPETLKPGSPASITRVDRIKAFLAGRLSPASVLDVDYLGKQKGTAAEEAMMAVLRLLTHADPAVGGREPTANP